MSYVPKKNTKAADAMIRRKDILIKSLDQQLGNIKIACKAAGIDRKTFYNYYDADEEFRDKVIEIREGIKDDVISNWMRDIIDGKDIPGRIFWAKTQAKDRGYHETNRLEIEHKGDIIQVIPAFNPKAIEEAQIVEDNETN
jgi:hypothetical protein